jgi:hypothetical protein
VRYTPSGGQLSTGASWMKPIHAAVFSCGWSALVHATWICSLQKTWLMALVHACWRCSYPWEAAVRERVAYTSFSQRTLNTAASAAARKIMPHRMRNQQRTTKLSLHTSRVPKTRRGNFLPRIMRNLMHVHLPSLLITSVVVLNKSQHAHVLFHLDS